MVRSKVKLSYMEDDSARKTSYKKRNLGLVKKVGELSTLCGVDACSIVYGPNDHEPTICPSDTNEVRRIIERYMAIPEYIRVNKMMNQETFTRDRIKKLEERLSRLRKENHAKEMTQLMFNWMKGEGTSNLTPSQLKEISSMAEKKMKEITLRISTLNVGDKETMRGSGLGGDNTPQAPETMPRLGASFLETTRVPMGPMEQLQYYQANMDPLMKRASQIPMDVMQNLQENTYPPLCNPGFLYSEEMRPMNQGQRGQSSQANMEPPRLPLQSNFGAEMNYPVNIYNHNVDPIISPTYNSQPPLDPTMMMTPGMTMIPTPPFQEDMNPPITPRQQGFEREEDAMMPSENSYKGNGHGASSSYK